MKKPVSLVADFTLLPQAIALALEGKQLQPVFLPPHTGRLKGGKTSLFTKSPFWGMIRGIIAGQSPAVDFL